MSKSWPNRSKNKTTDSSSASDKEDLFNVDQCVICMEDFKRRNTVKLQCDHRFCTDCIHQMIKLSGQPEQPVRCPLCRRRTEVEDVYRRGGMPRRGRVWMGLLMSSLIFLAGAGMCRWVCR